MVVPTPPSLVNLPSALQPSVTQLLVFVKPPLSTVTIRITVPSIHVTLFLDVSLLQLFAHLPLILVKSPMFVTLPTVRFFFSFSFDVLNFCLYLYLFLMLLGGCPTTPKNCNDGIECTIDSCNASTGECSHIPDNFYCKDPNPCVINGTCTLTGCTALPKNCTADFEKQPFCTVWKCIDFLGCSGEPRQCANETNGTCTVFNCSETKAECEKTESACLSFFGSMFSF